MEQLHLPRTDLLVSALCLGTAEFGAGTDEATAFAMLDEFAAAGGNFLDTAAVYADWTSAGKGSSERLIGKWRAARKPADLVVATKGAHPELHAMGVPRFSRREITHDVETSLKNLGVDALDLWYLHRDDPATPVEEVLTVLEELRSAGKLRHYAASNWSTARLHAAEEAARAMGVAGFVANQPMWSLATPDLTGGDATMVAMNDETLAFHKQSALPVIPYSPQANGYFQKIADGQALPASVEDRYDSDLVRGTNRGRFVRLEALNAKMGLSITQLTLGFLRGQPFTVVPIIGPRTLAQLRDSLTAGDVRLSAAEIAALVA